MNLSNVKTGDSLIVTNGSSSKTVSVIRVTKTRIVTEALSDKHAKYANYHHFRISDGKDFGPLTYNVYGVLGIV